MYCSVSQIFAGLEERIVAQEKAHKTVSRAAKKVDHRLIPFPLFVGTDRDLLVVCLLLIEMRFQFTVSLKVRRIETRLQDVETRLRDADEELRAEMKDNKALLFTLVAVLSLFLLFGLWLFVAGK